MPEINLSCEEKEAIEDFKMRMEGDLPPNLLEDPFIFYRFMKARDFNVSKAEKMLRKHLHWRKAHQIDTLLEDFKPKEEGRSFCQITAIFDLDKLTFSNATSQASTEALLRLIHLHQDNMPEYLKTVYVINAPSFFVIMYSIMKATMSNLMTRKFHIIGRSGWKEMLLEKIDADVLPAFLGGNRTDPDGNPLCETFILHPRKTSPDYYLSNEDRYFKNTEEVKKIIIPQLGKKDVYIDITESGSLITWKFLVKSKDIGFGLSFDASNQAITEILPIERYTTSDGSEEYFYKTKYIGRYIIIFDNSYSWLISKEIEYCIQVIKPEKIRREL